MEEEGGEEGEVKRNRWQRRDKGAAPSDRIKTASGKLFAGEHHNLNAHGRRMISPHITSSASFGRYASRQVILTKIFNASVPRPLSFITREVRITRSEWSENNIYLIGVEE